MGTCRTGITRRAERATRTRRGVIWSPGSRTPTTTAGPVPWPDRENVPRPRPESAHGADAADGSPGTRGTSGSPAAPAPGGPSGLSAPGGDGAGTQEPREDADARTRGVEGIRGFDDEGVRGAFDTDAMPGATRSGRDPGRAGAAGGRARHPGAEDPGAPAATRARAGRRRRAFHPAPAPAAAQAGPGHQGRLGGAVRRAGLPGRSDRGGLVGTWYRRVLRGGRVRHRLRHTRAAYERTGSGPGGPDDGDDGAVV